MLYCGDYRPEDEELAKLNLLKEKSKEKLIPLELKDGSIILKPSFGDRNYPNNSHGIQAALELINKVKVIHQI